MFIGYLTSLRYVEIENIGADFMDWSAVVIGLWIIGVSFLGVLLGAFWAGTIVLEDY
jgi:hypothetical protein